MSKTKEISKGYSRKETKKLQDGSFTSKEFHFGKTIQIEPDDVEHLEEQKLSKEVKDVVDKEFSEQTMNK